ncbi:MAG: HlyD family efflux transporter periplasmic adaptor subunit [Bacteroidales bacterium]|nr:HlyD family efflux transporter periplasmic adaptor subunit [Bacteroidales bacterium]
MRDFIILAGLLFILQSCVGNNDKADAYGNFEAVETLISAESTGKLLKFNIETGQKLNAGDTIGLIDSAVLTTKLKQLQAVKEEINANSKDVLSQIKVLDEQKNVLLIEKKRIENLIADSAATQKQYDDIIGKIKVIDRQIESVKVKNSAILSKYNQVNAQIEELKINLNKCKIINPINGTVLEKYAEVFELALPGKSLYKIANLDTMELKVYVSGAQLPHIKIGQKAKVYIDKNENENTELDGTVSWISSTAEFTPKIIQTKEERVKLVYAVKLLVKNDGNLKIGMPGEVKF